MVTVRTFQRPDDRRRSPAALASARAPGARRPSRRGAIILELLIVVPILFIGTLAVFEFALLGVALQMVVHAADEGARTSALIGGNDGFVLNRVEAILGVQGIAVAPGEAAVRIEDGGLTTDYGNTGLLPFVLIPGPSPVAGDVRVTVVVPMLIANNRPVPNWLASFGFDWGSQVIHATAMTREE